MKETTNKTFWLLAAVIAVLGAAVISQSIAMSGLQKKIDTLAATGTKASVTDEEVQESSPPPQSVPMQNKNKGAITRTKPNIPANSIFDESFFGFDEDWDPFKEMRYMQERIDKMFGNAFNRFGHSDNFQNLLDSYAFVPDIDMEDKGDHILVKVNLPGLDDSKLNVKVEGQTLTVSGTIQQSKNESENNGKIIQQERRSGEFYRSITLPYAVKADEMKTEEKKGVLHITIPREKE